MAGFISRSYSYMAPRGPLEHMSFFLRLPLAYWRYRKCLREDFHRDSDI